METFELIAMFLQSCGLIVPVGQRELHSLPAAIEFQKDENASC